MRRRQADDEFLAPTGRVMEMLSEHQCEGWLEGYLLTGRHGLFNCYEAFIHIVDSMFNQHAKWLKVTSHLPWRRKIASLNYLLASHVWRQDHNGFTHQDPGFIDHVVNKKAEIVRVYLPPDANCLLSVMDHCLRSRHYVNVVVAGKHPAPQWLAMDAAAMHCTQGIGIWDWASSDPETAPDVVMACCGDVPTLETLAAVSILREHLPELKIRVVNVVDLMKLQPQSEHPHGLGDDAFDALFTTDKPVIFAFHSYPSLIHKLTYRRTNHSRIHVRGYKEEGTITTPFDMTVLNDLDRFHLVISALDRLPQTGEKGLAVKRMLRAQADRAQALHRAGRAGPAGDPRLEVGQCLTAAVGRPDGADDGVELVGVDVRDHPVRHAVARPVGRPEATFLQKLRFAVFCAGRPDERIDDVGALPVDQGGGRMAVEIVDPAAEEHRARELELAHRWRKVELRREPWLDGVMI